MEKIVHVADRMFKIVSEQDLTAEQIGEVIKQLEGQCANCGKALALSPATCPPTLNQNDTKTLTASASGGTPPHTYSWEITKPDATKDTRTGNSITYQFALAGAYTIKLTVTDSCAQGAKTCTDSCTINVVAPCPAPTCSFTVT